MLSWLNKITIDINGRIISMSDPGAVPGVSTIIKIFILYHYKNMYGDEIG